MLVIENYQSFILIRGNVQSKPEHFLVLKKSLLKTEYLHFETHIYVYWNKISYSFSILSSISGVLSFPLFGSSSQFFFCGEIHSPKNYMSPVHPIRMLCTWSQALPKPGTPHSSHFSGAQSQTLPMTQHTLTAWHCPPCSRPPKHLLALGRWEPSKGLAVRTPWDAPMGVGLSCLLVVSTDLWGPL